MSSSNSNNNKNVLTALTATLGPEVVAKIAGSNSDVARHAMRIGEQFVNQWPAIGEAMLGQLGSSDLQVKLQLACSLGEWNDPRAADRESQGPSQRAASLK